MDGEIYEVEHRPVVRRNVFFRGVHERIQNKYQEMQKRLEKSRSVDSLSTISDDYSYRETRFSSQLDLRVSEEISSSENEASPIINKQAIVEERVHRQNAVSEDIQYVDIKITDSNGILIGKVADSVITEDEWEKIENDNITKHNSLESLNEFGKDSDDSSVQPATSPRTIRDRIEFRLQAVKERRELRRLEKERIVKEKRIKEKKESREKVEKFVLSNSAKDLPVTKWNKRNKVSTLTIALIEATGLESTTDERTRLLQCRFRLGAEKYKSKIVKSNTTEVQWQELVNLNMFDEHVMLETTLWDSNTFLGRNLIDVSELEKEKTHKLKIDLEGEMDRAKIFLLLTISGFPLLNTITDADDVKKAQNSLKIRTRAWYNLENNFSEVGWLSVLVYGAKGLGAQDCYCEIKLINDRVQTHTEHKTNDPSWMKIFTFALYDITSILEISVFEEKKSEAIGKISIPLLRIRNGEKVWYALKDHTQRERAKGKNPRILLEMKTSWHLVSASIRVIQPKEPDLLKPKPKVDRRAFARNIARAKAVASWTLDTLKIAKTCFQWESRKDNTIALILWIIFCYYCKIWMLPLLLLIPFIRYRPEKYYLVNWRQLLLNTDDQHVVKVEKQDSKSLRQKINSLQEMILTVQNGIGKFASVGESVKNLCNFSVPFVSLLAIFFILLLSLLMYMVHVKYILIGYGIHRFSRKILQPNRIPNSEIMDLISRVPDDDTLLDCEELLLENTDDDEDNI